MKTIDTSQDLATDTRSEANDETHRRHIRSFVIRAGRMTDGQERAWQELWPQFGRDYSPKTIDLDALFGRNAPRILEIGFGTGDALIEYAQKHPEHDCIGIEVHPPGVGHCLLKTKELQLSNVRVLCHDAVEVLSNSLPPQSIDEVHIFFPDPWHKKRHHKRRLIQAPFVNLLDRVLKSGGIVKLGTDWENYAEQMLQVMTAHASFANTASVTHPELPSGFVARPEHRPLTRFERRGQRLGHGVWDLQFQKR